MPAGRTAAQEAKGLSVTGHDAWPMSYNLGTRRLHMQQSYS